MKPGDIVYLDTEIKSFSWQNGLKIIINIDKENNRFHLCTIDEKGNPQKYSDDRYMCLITGLNASIYPTKLTYQLEEDFTYL